MRSSDADTERATGAPWAGSHITRRPRRLRQSPTLRRMVREPTLGADDFVHPIFVPAGTNIERPIGSMPRHSHRSVDMRARDIEESAGLGVPAVLLFGIPSEKDGTGSGAWD